MTHFHEYHFDINFPSVLPHGFFPCGYQTKILYNVTESFLWNGFYSLIQQSDIFIFLCYEKQMLCNFYNCMIQTFYKILIILPNSYKFYTESQDLLNCMWMLETWIKHILNIQITGAIEIIWQMDMMFVVKIPWISGNMILLL